MDETLHIAVAGIAAVCLALASACAWPAASPLRDWREIVARADTDSGRLRVSADALRHPLLPAIAVDPDDGLDPDETAVLAVLLSPDLAAARAARGESAAALLAAGLLPNPVFGAEYAHPYGSDASSASATNKLTLSIDTASLLTRAARTAAASARTREVDLGIAWQEWQVAQSARLQTVRLSGLRRRLPLVRTRAAGEAELADLLARALERGDVARTVLTAQLERARAARRQERELASAESSARIALDALLGVPAETELAIAPANAAAAWRAASGADVEHTFGACFERRLDLAALRAGYDAQEAALRESLLEQLPQLSVGISHERNDSRVSFLGGVVSLGLPLFDRGQARVALAEATRERLRLEYDARVASARSELAGALDELARLEAARRELARTLPQSEALWTVQQAAAERGDLDRVAEQAARANLLDQELELESLVQAEDEVGIALETACGGSVALAQVTP